MLGATPNNVGGFWPGTPSYGPMSLGATPQNVNPLFADFVTPDQVPDPTAYDPDAIPMPVPLSGGEHLYPMGWHGGLHEFGSSKLGNRMWAARIRERALARNQLENKNLRANSPEYRLRMLISGISPLDLGDHPTFPEQLLRPAPPMRRNILSPQAPDPTAYADALFTRPDPNFDYKKAAEELRRRQSADASADALFD